MVDGALFREGHIRLQKVYINKDQDKIEYEILFFGEVRDFASSVGDKSLCDIDLSDLNHERTYLNIATSWEAYPETASPTAGLKDGNVLYPLIDFGNTYPGTGANQNATGEPRIAIDQPSADGG